MQVTPGPGMFISRWTYQRCNLLLKNRNNSGRILLWDVIWNYGKVGDTKGGGVNETDEKEGRVTDGATRLKRLVVKLSSRTLKKELQKHQLIQKHQPTPKNQLHQTR